MDLGLGGKVAAITGASVGIGLGVAEAFAREGAHVLMAARGAERLEQEAGRIAREFGVRAIPVACDVATVEGADALIAAARKEFGGADILVNNAGTGSNETIMEASDDKWQAYWELHVMAAVRLARGFVPLSNLAASLGLAQLDRRETFERHRRLLADTYDELLGDVLEPLRRDPTQVPFRWVAQTDAGFDGLRAALDARGIAVRRPVDPLLHHELGLAPGDFPVAERLYRRTVSLPLYPALRVEQARHVAAQVREVLA